MGSSGARSREGSGEAKPFLPMPQDCPALWICQRLSSASALACLRRSAWPCKGEKTSGDVATCAESLCATSSAWPCHAATGMCWAQAHRAQPAHPSGASPPCWSLLPVHQQGSSGGDRSAACPSHLQDSDVPGKALQRFLQLPPPQPLLGLDAVQLLVEVHTWACGTRSCAQHHGAWGQPLPQGMGTGGPSPSREPRGQPQQPRAPSL